MLKYILKRLLIFIPTLFVIALATFYLSVNVPGDPVEQADARRFRPVAHGDHRRRRTSDGRL